jgi:hypothetical protein
MSASEELAFAEEQAMPTSADEGIEKADIPEIAPELPVVLAGEGLVVENAAKEVNDSEENVITPISPETKIPLEDCFQLNGRGAMNDEFIDSLTVLLAREYYLQYGQIYLDFTVAVDHTPKEIEYIVCYAQNLADNQDSNSISLVLESAGQELPEYPQDALIRIILPKGEIAYTFVCSYFYPGAQERNGEYEQYKCYALSWPPGEGAYSFIYDQHTYEHSSDTVLETIDARLYGKEIFSATDILALRDSLSFTIGDCLHTVVAGLGTPDLAEVDYWESYFAQGYYEDEPYLEYYVYFSYDFGEAMVVGGTTVDVIYIRNGSVAGPRGIRVGDSYEQVLEQFPVLINTDYEDGLDSKELYCVPALFDGVYGNFGSTGEIYYDENGYVKKIEYFAGFPEDIGASDWVFGYSLNYLIEDGKVSEIQLRFVWDNC